jgi:hypothetical protein
MLMHIIPCQSQHPKYKWWDWHSVQNLADNHDLSHHIDTITDLFHHHIASMNIYEGLESLSFCIMTEQVKKALRKDPRNAEAVLNIPYKLITYVCKAVHSNIYNDIQLSPQQKDSLKFISNVLKEDESIIHAGINAYATFINPLEVHPRKLKQRA